MFPWLVSTSLAIAAPTCAPIDHAAWIEAVRAKGEEAAYRCLATDDGSSAALLAAIAADTDSSTGSHRRMQRALAIHVMQRLDAPADVTALRALNASDRRLLRDAVHARRGRASPIPEHHSVFEKFDWYDPNPRFTNRALTPLDQDNLVVIDKPPRAPRAESPEDAPAREAVPEAARTSPRPASTTGACGCATGLGASGLVWLAGLWAVGSRRRR